MTSSSVMLIAMTGLRGLLAARHEGPLAFEQACEPVQLGVGERNIHAN
jgi:hypothetical protein